MSDETQTEPPLRLSDRQKQVLGAITAGYLSSSTPVGSATVSYLLPVRLSAASVRNTMAELSQLGLIEKPHASAGRVPTERGLRHFVDELLEPAEIAARERRSLDLGFDDLDEVGKDRVLRQASDLIARHTGQLGFVLAPRLESEVLRHVSLVRISSERLLAVLVSSSGRTHQRIVDDPGSGDQSELDRVAALLNEQCAGQTLSKLRGQLHRDVRRLRREADRLRRRVLEIGLLLADAQPLEQPDLVVATHFVLLDQPEFQDPERVRELFSALETRVQLVELIDRLLEARDVSVALGDALEEVGLHHCAVVAAPYATGETASGALGVIGPSRMDYRRVIPLVSYCSRRIGEVLTL